MHHSRSGKKRFVTEILLHALKFKCKATAIADLCTSGEAWRLKSNLLQAISWVLFPHSLLSELPCKVKTKTAVETCYISTITTFVPNSSSIWLNKHIFFALDSPGFWYIWGLQVHGEISSIRQAGCKMIYYSSRKIYSPCKSVTCKSLKVMSNAGIMASRICETSIQSSNFTQFSQHRDYTDTFMRSPPENQRLAARRWCR